VELGSGAARPTRKSRETLKEVHEEAPAQFDTENCGAEKNRRGNLDGGALRPILLANKGSAETAKFRDFLRLGLRLQQPSSSISLPELPSEKKIEYPAPVPWKEEMEPLIINYSFSSPW
jgi:hypothetical protein